MTMHSRGLLLLVSLCCTVITADQNNVNVAINKTCRQISTYSNIGVASNAADNNTAGTLGTKTCSHTNSTSEGVGIPTNVYHWWEVDLGRIYPVHNITVWARKEPDIPIFFDRLYPFMITVDNKTCVNVTSPPTTRSNSVTCSSVLYGQVVRLTLTKVNKTLSLCEFQIFGCKSGFFGSTCICHANCEGGCDNTNGDCTNCKVGFWGPYHCQQSCPANCAGNTCRRADGRCDDCAQGYYRDGLGCQRCRSACKRRECNRETGKCNACPDQWYGQFCNMSCTPGCGQCDQNSGSCNTCADNLIFPECTDCVDGYYGSAPPCIMCPGTCYNDTPCDKTTGHCDECPLGKKGDSCMEVKQESWVVPVVGSLAAALLITIGVVVIMCWCRRSREDIEENDQRVAPPVEPESTQDRDRPSSASPISDADTTVYEIIDKDDADKLHVQENNYESPHPYSNDDADRALYMQLSPPPSDEAL